MKSAHFYLKLSPEELLEYYQGHKRYVRVRAYEGYSLQFRADHLRQWVKPNGIHGEFEIRFDSRNKFAGLFLYRDLSVGSSKSTNDLSSRTEAPSTPQNSIPNDVASRPPFRATLSAQAKRAHSTPLSDVI